MEKSPPTVLVEHSTPSVSQEVLPSQLTREDLVRALLDPPTEVDGQSYHYSNYEFARESGLLDTFYYNPETGEDALVHILAGDVKTSPSGAVEVAGFHHESSAVHPETYVDLKPLEGKNRQDLRDFQRYPFEPYNTHVVIEGYPKGSVFKKAEDGSISRTQSSMFPQEYDALTVLQSIRLAKDKRDTSQDRPGPDNTIIAEGDAPMLDGESAMRIKLILDANTKQVVAAFPRPKRKGIMHMQPGDVERHLGIE